MRTPLGSAVAPEVKMISATSSRVIFCSDVSGGRVAVGPLELVQLPEWRIERRRERRHVLADQDDFRADDARDAREKIWRRAVIDRDDDDAAQQAAPEGDDPLPAGSRSRRTILSPLCKPPACSRAANPRAARAISA